MGRLMASEQLKARAQSRPGMPPMMFMSTAGLAAITAPAAAMIGASSAAVPELLMNVLMKMAMKEARKMVTMIGSASKGMAASRWAARPVFCRPRPSAKPPATSQRTSHAMPLRSLAVITPVSVKAAIGIMAMTLEFRPRRSPNTQSRIVTAKVT